MTTNCILERVALYHDLETSLAKSQYVFDIEQVHKMRLGFCFNKDVQQFEPKEYELVHPHHGVHLICIPLPEEIASMCRYLGEEIVSSFGLTSQSSSANIYINAQDTMHVTLFHTARPEETRPTSQAICQSEIAILEDLLTTSSSSPSSSIHPQPQSNRSFHLVFDRVCVASSGAILLLMKECNASGDGTSLDQLRMALRRSFPHAPKTQTSVIIHATLARVLNTAGLSQDMIRQASMTCNRISQRLQKSPVRFLVDRIAYIQESHDYSARGKRTIITLGQ